MTDKLMMAVILVVGLTLLGGLSGIVALSLINPGQGVPDVLQNVTIGALTLLGGLLVPRPAQPAAATAARSASSGSST